MTPLPAGSMALALGGSRAVLLAERALWLPAHAALLVADLHWGKAAALRAAQVPVPAGTTDDDLARLTQALAVTGATRLVVLGDLLHARTGRHPATLVRIEAWRAQHAALSITLVRGNHDAHAGDPPAGLGIRCHDAPLAIGGLCGVHDPTGAEPGTSGYVVGGHLHPTVVLHGRGRQRLRLPCFVVGPSRAVLPAFSAFTGGGMYVPDAGDRCYAVAGGEVIGVGS